MRWSEIPLLSGFFSKSHGKRIVDKIRKKYPYAARNAKLGPYCVGGAYIHFVKQHQTVFRAGANPNFPPVETLTEAITQHYGIGGSQWKWDSIYYEARFLAWLNDNDGIELAWRHLGYTLNLARRLKKGDVKNEYQRD